MNRKIKFAAAALAAVVTLGTVAGNTVYAADSVSITNVSYDPTREFYEVYNGLFENYFFKTQFNFTLLFSRQKNSMLLVCGFFRIFRQLYHNFQCLSILFSNG